MKRALLVELILCCSLGCGNRPTTQEEKAIAASRFLIAALTTNASVRAILESDAVRENLKDVKEESQRNALIAEWREALKNIPVDGIRPSRRYATVRAACRVLNMDLIGAMWEAGASYETRWDVRLDTIRWLNLQANAMKPDAPAKVNSWSEENEKWDAYIGMVEYLESEIEDLEINGFDVNAYPDDVDKMEAIRAKFENLIGRPVRKREDITGLGLYAKQARTRFQKERDAALKKASRK